MKTRPIALLLCLLLLLSLPVHAAEDEIIHALNAVLTGTSDFNGAPDAVSEWSEDQLVEVLYRKLLHWDYSPYEDHRYFPLESDIQEGEAVYDLTDIQTICQSAFGLTFPARYTSNFLRTDGEDLYLALTDGGEGIWRTLHDYIQTGDLVTAIGIQLSYDNISSRVDGYFLATFRVNPDSIYGYTLLSVEEIPGNQPFTGLTAEATSELVQASATHYASNVLDGDPATAWVEGAQGVGVGEWLRISAPLGETMTIYAISFLNGYHKSDSTLERNGMPWTIQIECSDGYTQTVEFYNTEEAVELGRPVSVQWVKLTILEASPGSKYEDTCISEVTLHGLNPVLLEAYAPQEPQPTIPAMESVLESTPETTSKTIAPTPIVPAEPPQSGNSLWLWVGGGLAAAAAVAFLLLKKRGT